MIQRYLGNENREKRIAAFCEQFLINGNREFAEYFADHCEPKAFIKGDKIIEQDSTDTDIFFIVIGSADIYVNQRSIAIRNKTTHVGEMALLDDTAKRSASVIAKEDTVVFRVTQDDFLPFANKHPELWQRIAVELSNRIRERSKFIKVPNAKPIVFVGSSSESINKVKQVQEVLLSAGIDVKCWDDNELFALSESTLDELVEILDNYDYAIFYVSGDDKLETRGTSVAQPRDNVILELGMSIGFMKRDRTFIFIDEDPCPNLPSDLKGITYLPIKFEAEKLSGKTIELIKTKVVSRINVKGVK